MFVVYAPDNALSWEISPSAPGIYTKTQILHVKANTDWQLGVKDSDTDVSGSMREWSGSGYGDQNLSLPMKVSVERVGLPFGGGELPIAEGKMTGARVLTCRLPLSRWLLPRTS